MPNYLGNDPVKMQKLADALDALRPFAKAAEYAETDETDNYGLEGSSARFELTLGDLRRAAKVLSELCMECYNLRCDQIKAEESEHAPDTSFLED